MNSSAFSKQIPVQLILLLFLMETAALKCYQQPGIDPKSVGRKTPVDEEVRLFEENKDKWIELNCESVMDNCVVATGCKSPLPIDALNGVYELRGCVFSKTEICKLWPCTKCRTCDTDLCNGGEDRNSHGNGGGGNGGIVYSAENGGNGMNPGAMFSSMLLLMLATGLFVAFVPIMVG